MGNSINYEKLHNYSNAYVIYELVTNGVDIRNTLEGSTLRSRAAAAEGYKYDVYDKYHSRILSGGSYVDMLLEAFPGVNLASYHQKPAIEALLESGRRGRLEEALTALYEGDDDKAVFQQIVNLLNGSFDVLGFIYFLKDRDKYMPIRSRTFDEKFALLDLDSKLSGHCNWERYQEYNGWLKEIKIYLARNVNRDFSLLDAHSFVWILNGIVQFHDKEIQIVEHDKYGKGTIIGFGDIYVEVQFPGQKETKKFNKDTVFNKGILRMVPVEFSVYDSEGDQRKDHKMGSFSSWTMRNETLAIKQCDKSFFDYRGSTIPREIYWFFGVENLDSGYRKNIRLRYNAKLYDAYLHREVHELARIRLFWETALAKEFEEYNTPGSLPQLMFKKTGDEEYDVSFEERTVLSKKAVEVTEALLKLIANRTRITTYGELSGMTQSKPSPYYEMRFLLDAINQRCEMLNLPHISAMVVNKNTGLPGEGFRELCIKSFGYDSELSTQEIFDAELDKIGKCDEWHKLAEHLGINMPVEDEELLPEEADVGSNEAIIEGAKKTITVNSYERDPKAKKVCKDYYMKQFGHISCQICGFDFGKYYGSEYANKIHFHHIIPVSEIGEEYVIDPVKDLLPVCPNCHMLLHAGKGISIGELKERLGKTE